MTTEKKKPRYFTKALRCPDGSRKYIRGKTKAELEEKVRVAMTELGYGVNINDNTRVVEFAQMWVDTYKRRKMKPQSVAVVLSMLNNHILPVIGAMRVRDVKPADCVLVLTSSGDLAVATSKLIRSIMQEMFTCAVENNLILRSPVTRAVAPVGRPARPRVPLTVEQLDRLVRAAENSRTKSRLCTFVLLCAYAGLREGEALGLNMSNVDTKAGVIHVREQYVAANVKAGAKSRVTSSLKTDAARRTVPMPPILLSHMVDLERAGVTGYLFSVEQSNLAGSMGRRLRNLCLVGPDGAPRDDAPSTATLDFYVHPHLLRHTYASYCVASGMDVKEVQYLLGHTEVGMTLDVYSHYHSETRIAATAQKLDVVFPGTEYAVVGQ